MPASTARVVDNTPSAEEPPEVLAIASPSKVRRPVALTMPAPYRLPTLAVSVESAAPCALIVIAPAWVRLSAILTSSLTVSVSRPVLLLTSAAPPVPIIRVSTEVELLVTVTVVALVPIVAN